MRVAWRRAEIALAIVLALSHTLRPVSAQEPQLKPISEYLAQIDQDPVDAIRYVNRRCASLHLLISEVSLESSPELSETYLETASRFIAVAIRAEEALGSSAENSRESTQLALSDIMELYRVRFRHNMAVSGSYFVDDPLARADLEVCSSLADPEPQGH
jgi:hypothetical protein